MTLAEMGGDMPMTPPPELTRSRANVVFAYIVENLPVFVDEQPWRASSQWMGTRVAKGPLP